MLVSKNPKLDSRLSFGGRFTVQKPLWGLKFVNHFVDLCENSPRSKTDIKNL